MQAEAGFSGSYNPADVAFLLRRLDLQPTPLIERERQIQSGQRHYSEMIGPEDAPSRQRMRLFRECLGSNGARFAGDLVHLAKALDESATRRDLTIVSIARAGTPVGVLLRRLLMQRHAWPAESVRHFSISVIRDRGVDFHALAWITARHDAETIRFVDGWTGKGTIAGEIRNSLSKDGSMMSRVDPGLWTPLDIGGCARWAAGDDDYLIPSSLLGGTISGLISRSVLPRNDIGAARFHGCVALRQLRRYDVSRWFIRHMETLCAAQATADRKLAPRATRFAEAQQFIEALMSEFAIADRNRVKIGIGEAVRVALRRLPDRILLREVDTVDGCLISRLAALRGITIEQRADMPVSAVALIASTLAVA